MQLVTTREHTSPKYILLQPGTHPPRTGETYQVLAEPSDIPHILADISKSTSPLALDVETRGSDYSLTGEVAIRIVGMGLAWDTGSVYLNWTELTDLEKVTVLRVVLARETVLAHNVYFDGGVLFQELLALGVTKQPKWLCTYSLAAMLANESPEQRWGLKHLMVELLGWGESNEADLEEWLVRNGFYTGTKYVNRSPEEWVAIWEKGGLSPDRGEMWRVPQEILGKYCVLDAEACYLLYTEVLGPVLGRFPQLETMVREEWMPLIQLLVEQKIGGIEIDRAGLQDRIQAAHLESGVLYDSLLSMPEIIPLVKLIEEEMLIPLREKQPPRLKKDGDVSKNWLKWQEKMEAATAGTLPEFRFNINSDQQLRNLLYEKMGFEIRLTTDSGLPAVSGLALKAMGPVGAKLIDYNSLQKELGYLQDYLERIEHRPTIHPSFRTPGAVTGRLSSRDPNLQQVPKSKAVMSLFQARPGTVWVDIDFAALEAVVAAEFSQDPNMLLLYGDGMPENDIHLFLAAQVPGEMGQSVLATGYRPTNPPPGTVGRAKKEAKKWRNIAKTVVYACQFGAGVQKIMSTLEADGIFLPYDQVETIHSTYWSTFAGVKRFGKDLFFQWRRNHGYILNGLGRPMAVAEDYSKDILNRFIQSTGHDILVKYIRIYTDELTRRQIPWRPVIVDWHDATTVEVPTECREAVVDVFNWAMGELNLKLGGTIQLSGKPTWGTTLADVKEPES